MSTRIPNTNGKTNDKASNNIPIVELRKELNDALYFLTCVCQDNMIKDKIIAQQDKYIQSLIQQLQQMTILNSIPTSHNNYDNNYNISLSSNTTYSMQNNYNVFNVTNQFNMTQTSNPHVSHQTYYNNQREDDAV